MMQLRLDINCVIKEVLHTLQYPLLGAPPEELSEID